MKYTSPHIFLSRPPSQILLEILDLKRRSEIGERIDIPLITLMLNTRNTVCGFLVDYKMEEHQSPHLMMELAGSSDIFFTKASAVEGLIVHAIEKIDYLLFDISMEQIAVKDQVTRYQVKARMQEESKRLSLFFDKPVKVKISQEVMEYSEGFFLKNLVTDIATVLIEIGEDKEQSDEIQNSVDEIVLMNGRSLELYIDTKKLLIKDTLDRSYSTNHRRRILKDAMTSLLKKRNSA